MDKDEYKYLGIFENITIMQLHTMRKTAYTAGIINWTEQHIKTLNTNTRKLLTIYGVHHPKADIARLYVRRQGGHGLGSVNKIQHPNPSNNI